MGNIIQAVTFFGSSKIEKNSGIFKQVFETASLLAQNGLTVVNGGGPGVMLATTLGAKNVGGKVSVVYFDPKEAESFEGKNKLNSGDIEITESNYLKRTQKLLELGDAYIFFKGGTGTMSEFTMAWGIAKLYFGHNKPLILFGSFWRDIVDAIKNHMMISQKETNVFTIVEKPESVISAIQKFDIMAKLHKHSHTEDMGDEGDFIL